jgi:hypothetical protein
MTCKLKFLVLLAACFIAGADPVGEVTSVYGEPDVFSFSWSDYVGQGTNNFEIKMLMTAYLDSLDSALDSLYLEVRAKYSSAPELLQYLDSSHSSYLDYAEEWSRMCEERMWWDLEDGTRSDGTARGYTYAYALALHRWRKIVSYEFLLRSDSPWQEGTPDSGLGLDQIGGYFP